jgi:hypothetical protein
MTQVKEFIATELTQLERGFVATPACRENLEAFMQANHGSNDFLLMQMAIQYGAKIALENVAEAVAMAEQGIVYAGRAE